MHFLIPAIQIIMFMINSFLTVQFVEAWTDFLKSFYSANFTTKPAHDSLVFH